MYFANNIVKTNRIFLDLNKTTPRYSKKVHLKIQRLIIQKTQ